MSPSDLADEVEQITTPFQLRRRGAEAKLVIDDTPATPDLVLLRTLRDAQTWIGNLKQGIPLREVARAAGHHDVYIRTRSQIAFLSPKIQRAILDGTLSPEITLKHLTSRLLPLNWKDQDRLCHLN